MDFSHQFVPGAHWLGIGAVILSASMLRVLVVRAKPVKRPLAWLAVAAVVGFAAITFQLMVLNALAVGEVTCLSKGCDRMYTWSQDRPMFWGNVLVLQVLTCVAWALSAYAIGFLLGLWRLRSNKTMEPTR